MRTRNYTLSNLKLKIKTKNSILFNIADPNLGSWNVRTMQAGLTKDILDTDGLRKAAVISRELDRLNVDIAALQETHLAGFVSLKEKDYTFFWHGKADDEP